MSARLIWLFERAGWVYDVRWPNQRGRAPGGETRVLVSSGG